MSVCSECCVLSGIGLYDEMIIVQRSSNDCGVSEYDRGTSQKPPRPLGLLSHEKKKEVTRY
jgi:hypothetical protein